MFIDFFQNGSSVNTYSNSEHHYSDQSSHSLSDGLVHPHESGSSSISNLWNLLDNIEKQTISGDSSNSTHSYNQEDKEIIQTNSNFDLMQNMNETSYSDSKPVVPITFLPSTTENVLIKTTTDKQDKLYTHAVERGDIGPENNLRPQEDIGRGDIGPDDSPQNNPLEIIEIKPVQTTPKPKEIATLNMTKEMNKTAFVSANDNNQIMDQLETDLSVLSLTDQKQFVNHNEEDNWKLQGDIQKTTSTTPKTFSIEHGPGDFEQQNTDQFENAGQQVENLNQQSYNQFEGFDQANFGQNNVDHQMVDFGQQSEHLGQEHFEPQFENFNQQNVNLHQQDFNQGFVGQSPDEIQQQNMDQQFETPEQPQENLNLQSFNQQEEFGQQSESFGQEHQQLDNFGQQSGGFQQEDLNDFAQHEQFQQESLSEFGHHVENMNQPQREQQLESRDQQNENLEQQGPTEHLNEQVQIVSKPSEDLLQTDQVETFVPTSTYHKDGRELPNSIPKEPVVEQEIVTQRIINVDAPPEIVTEKVGFWNKVGSKLSSAKDKVSSWFRRS